MKMTFRWYSEGNDNIKLSDIKQIPGVRGIVWALHHKMPGEVLEEEEEIAEVKAQCDKYGFNIDVVESVNVHDDIKIGLPRLLVDEPSIDRFLKMVDDEYNCLTLCSGSLNANPNNNVADIVRKHCDRIAFAHIRNVKHFENGDFSEASHRDCDGDTRILDILKAYHDCGYKGYVRPDHGRHLWGEKAGTVRPGYGLYDRALGIMYMLGVWDMLDKINNKGE